MRVDLAALLRQIGAALDQFGIRYAVGGSVASSFHGVPRATNGLDLVAEILPEQAGALAAALSPDFYADQSRMRDSLLNGRAFSIIHLETTYKVDFLPVSRGSYDEQQLARRMVVQSEWLGEPLTVSVVSAEDTILGKLAWFKKGGCESSRLWNDVLGVVRMQEGRLDLPYLLEWAPRLGVAEWLERALREGTTPLAAGPRPPETPSS
jgi:hypothetical protein